MNCLPAPNAVLSSLSCDYKFRCFEGKYACKANGIKCTDICSLKTCDNQPLEGSLMKRGWPRWRWNRPWWKWGRWKVCYRLWLAYYFYDFFTLFNITLVETLFTKIFRKCLWWRVEIVRWKIFLFKTFIKVYPFIKVICWKL